MSNSTDIRLGALAASGATDVTGSGITGVVVLALESTAGSSNSDLQAKSQGKTGCVGKQSAAGTDRLANPVNPGPNPMVLFGLPCKDQNASSLRCLLRGFEVSRFRLVALDTRSPEITRA